MRDVENPEGPRPASWLDTRLEDEVVVLAKRPVLAARERVELRGMFGRECCLMLDAEACFRW